MAQKTESGVVPQLSNRVYLFNYFERPHLSEKDFVEFWEDAAKYIQTRDHFISTHLHRAVGDARFSWVNFAVFDSDDVCCFGKPDPKWMERMKSAAGSNLKAFPGRYSEIASYSGDKLSDGGKERPEKERFLLTAVIADDSVSSDDLELNWKSWMKTDFIHQQLKGNPNLKDSLLYRMEKARNPLVKYTVRTELTEMTDEEGIALAESVNNQPNAKGIETVTSLYQIYTNMFYKKE